MDNIAQIQTETSNKMTRALLLLGISLGYFMVLLDTTVVSIALPAIHADMGVGIVGLQWVVNSYTLVFTGFLLSMGGIADKLGAKRVYVGGLVLFLAASAVSAAVPSLPWLIAMRAVLGIGGAALMPSSLSLIARAFPEPAKRARVMGIWAAVTGIAMASGPVIGGFLVDSFGWRSIFLLNVPLAAASVLLTSRLVPETKRNRESGFDWLGQLLAIAAITALSFAIMEGEVYGWGSPVIAGGFGFSALSILWFLIHEAKAKAPLLPLHIFRNPTVSAGMVNGMAINFGLSAVLFILPLFYEQIRGLSAHMAGLALLPMTIPLAVNPVVTGRIVGRFGARIPMTAGFALTAIGVLLQTGADTDTGHILAAIGLLLIGLGVSLTIPSLMTAVISAAPKEQTGTVSGALNSSRQLGATLAVAFAGAIINGSESFTAGMRVSFLAAAVILLGGSLLSYLLMGRRKG
ncbi:MFS transporter [Paenibacillus sp. OAS669]|uniref:MFS transporter n=1 Tax=Paenibacillus sp. OAS669 TaxID=2663821 RepID=UPI001A0917E3|nr:MFS transporter [Paenibacillus sp. OAS669]MBE1442407.1 DHA2 family methylenomycin A resistance protein-like MFS transporter [Paenibacillus sp. OAS669]